MTPQANPQVVEFEGARHEFPADFSQADISKALASLHPQAQATNPEGFLGGLWRNVSGILGGPRPTAQDWLKLSANQIAATADQLAKAKDAHDKGRPIEALGHLAGATPLIGPPAAHAGETLGGTEAQYDKFGNIVKQGLKPDVSGALGETAGLLAPIAAEPALAGTVRGGRAVATAATKPGTFKIAAGGGETLAGAASLAHGNLWGIYPLMRGLGLLKGGIAERGAAAAAASDAELEQFAPGFSTLSARDQATTRMIFDRMKAGPPPSAPPPGPIQGPLVPPSTSNGRTIADIAREELSRQAQPAPTAATVPQVAPPAPAAPAPPETPPQATGGPVPAKGEPFKAAARETRSANADSLSQAFNDAGVTSDSLRKLRVWDWPKAAQQVGVDFPVTHSARLKLIRDTLGALEQKEAAAPKAATAPQAIRQPSAPIASQSTSRITSTPPTAITTPFKSQAATAEGLAKAFQDKGVTSKDISAMIPQRFRVEAEALGYEVPAGQTARIGLRDETVNRLQAKEGAKTP